MIKTTVTTTLAESRATIEQNITDKIAQQAEEPWSWSDIMLSIILAVLIVGIVILVVMSVAAAGVAMGRSYQR